MFKECPSYSPAPQDYIWIAEYYKGSLSEFDFETAKENSFYDIEKEKLVRFGLVGMGRKLWFECSRGPFNLLGKRIDIRYRTENEIFNLTKQNVYQRDIITYKKAFSEANVANAKGGRQELAVNILSYSFGYKSEMTINDTTFNFKPIVTLPHGGGNEFILTIDLSADKDLDGRLELLNDNNVVNSYEAPLKKSVTGRLHWKFK